MEFNELKELIELFSSQKIDELELEMEGISLKLGKKKPQVLKKEAAIPISVDVEHETSVAEPSGSDRTPDSDSEEGLIPVNSPIVGTFYRAPHPEADPFVEVGQTVAKGQTMCIVEAMKLMNEIHAERSGVVAKIHVENGEGVEYGQKLFSLRPA